MDDTNSTPDTDRTSEISPAPRFADSPAMSEAAATAPDPRKRSRTRGLLIAGGAVLTVAVLAGGGIAVGAAIADEHDDTGTSTAAEDQDETPGAADDQDDDADDTAPVDLTGAGTDSADDLIALIEAASGAAEGEPVSIEMKADGVAEVSLRADDGAESEVRVAADGGTSVTSAEQAEAGDAAPRSVLDAESIQAIVTATLTEADGRILEIEADDDGASPYEATVITGAGQLVQIDLDGDFAIVSSGTAGTDD